MTLVYILLGLLAFYLWLCGWWFMGAVVCLAYGLEGTQAWGHSWPLAIIIGFAPLLVRRALQAERHARLAKQAAPAPMALTLLPRDSLR